MTAMAIPNIKIEKKKAQQEILGEKLEEFEKEEQSKKQLYMS